MTLLDHHLISERYFFPRPDQAADACEVACDGAVLRCFERSPHPGAPTLVYFHGNGEVVADYVPEFANLLLGLGVNVFLAEYRGYGGSTGEPALGAMLGDTERIVEHLGVPEKQLIVFGRSVGSIYAIELARRHPGIGGLIIESGIADPLERVLLRVKPHEMGVSLADFVAEASGILDHQRVLSAYKGPLLVLHAQEDHLVAASHGVRIHDWAGGKNKRLVLFPRGDHNSIFFANQKAYIRELASFLAKAGG